MNPIVKRILAIIPTLLIVSAIAFVLSRQMPGDPVEHLLELNGYQIDRVQDEVAFAKEYQRIESMYGYDLPIFYFSISKKTIFQNESLHYPAIRWNGFENQYHEWIIDFLDGNIGSSNRDGVSVMKKIGPSLGWTLALSLISIAITLLIGLPLGRYLFQYNAKNLQIILYALYSIPVFWMATLLITFFTTAEYGSWTDLFPTPGLWSFGTTWWQGMRSDISRLLLPILCLVLHDLPIVSRLLSSSMETESSKLYVYTALNKGLTRKQVNNKHILPNALLPITTAVIDSIPRSIAGTLVIEVIFNLPGMGRLMYDSIQFQDWNVLFVIILLISLVTIITFIIGDIIYAKVNPKIDLI